MSSSVTRPNIVFILSDDHAAHAISAYGSRINETPNIDRIAREGMLFRNCFCTNSVCAPSRATILTGQYGHKNGVTTLQTPFDGRRNHFVKMLQRSGYQTAIIGKWHLGHGGESDPTGFDYWNVLPGQGSYVDPEMIEMGVGKQHTGYVTDLITDYSIDWLSERDTEKPFCLFCHHKAPHRWWVPDEKHASMYDDVDIPEPETFWDTYRNRARPASVAEMRVDRDLKPRDLKQPVPSGLSWEDEKRWKYQRYVKDYLRCVASMDDNIGRLLDYLDDEGIAENTIVVYSSDQGFFLGDHGWYDKRFMYEESLRMPLLVRYPREIEAGSENEEIVLNNDFAPTLLELCGLEPAEEMQGTSFVPLLRGKRVPDWRTSFYYRYWLHLRNHNVYAHYGVRTHRYKLIFYYANGCNQPGAHEDPRRQEWELFDLKIDPYEMNNVYADPAYRDVVQELTQELARTQREADDSPYERIH
jgi:arylsulfatase A-like enzyme